MASARLQGLGSKLKILYAYTGLKQATLAKAVGRAESTIHEWVKGSDLRDPETVPDDGRELLAQLLVEKVGGLIGIERARQLWLGPLRDFAGAFVASTEEAFLELLSSVERTPLLTFFTAALEDLQLVNFGRPIPRHGDVQIAFINDPFALGIAGSPGRYLVLIVESAAGRHLGVPGADLADRIDPRGALRLPEEGCWTFDPPPGLHRFLLFALERDTPPSIGKLKGVVRPLGADDIELLVSDLSDQAATRSWQWDQVLVDVQPGKA